MPNHFLTKYYDDNKVENIEAHLMEQVQKGDDDLIGNLKCREKYWQVPLITLFHGNRVIHGNSIVPIKMFLEKRN